jgi:hypothetical protein
MIIACAFYFGGIMGFDTQYPHRKDWRKKYYGTSEEDCQHKNYRARTRDAHQHKHHKFKIISTELLDDGQIIKPWRFGMSEDLDVDYFVEVLMDE